MSAAPALERLLCEWLECEAHESVEDFISRYPEHEELLREHFELQELVEHAFTDPPALPERLGPFRIEKELGTGGMGTVYRAVVADPVRGIETGRTVALKVVHPHLFRTPGFFKRFLREAELGRRIEHANVVHTLDADAVEVDDRPQHYLVMEYVEGQTLRELVEDVDRVPEELARHIGCEVAKALSAIHAAGAVHRDLKPENVLITKDHEVKVMDLGVARLADEQMRLSQTGAFVGSLHYAAPEQFGGGADVDYRADLHGLGLLLYEIATGSHPYADEDARVVMRRILSDAPRKAGELNTQLSPFFEEFVARLLEKNPAARFGSAEALLDVLENAEQSAWWRARAKELRAETNRPLRRIRVPRETALYGRDAELARLRALYDAARAGEGHVVLIEGEAGIGKTRLVDEFVSRLQQEGEDLNFVFAGYPPGGAATASGAFSAAYREHLGEESLEDALAELLPQTPILVPAFAALLRGDAAPKDSEPLSKDSLQTCFVHLTRNLAAERTTIVLIDDLHFAPEEGRALFTSVALAAPGHRILLLGAMRPGVPKEWTAGATRLEQTRHLTIPRLGPKDLVRLLGDSFRSQRLAEELGGKIGVKSDGNPFFVFEIIRGLREGQFITQREDGSWHTTRLIEDIQVPSSVLDLVNTRVADLEDEDRHLLDVAACWGYEFDPSLVGAALGLPRLPVLQRLARIEKRDRVVRSAGRNYMFDHHQVQEALYGSLNEQLREEYHMALANALEEQARARGVDADDLGGALCADLCDQFLRGSVPQRAVCYLGQALDHLEAGHVHERAAGLAGRALSIDGLVEGARRVAVLMQQARSLNRRGRRERQNSALSQALEIARDLGDQVHEARVMVAMGEAASQQGRVDDGRAMFERGRRLAHDTEQAALEVRAIGGLGMTLMDQGRLDDAADMIGAQIEFVRRTADLRSEAGATVNLGTVRCEQGRLDEARELFERGLEICLQVGHREWEANAIGNLGVVLLYQGRPEEAGRMFERDLQIAREIGHRPGEAAAIGNLGEVHQRLGRAAAARECMLRCLELEREMGDMGGVALGSGVLAGLFLAAGRSDRAHEFAEEALRIARTIGVAATEANAHGVLGDILVFDGRLADARERFSRYLEMSVEHGMLREEAGAHGNLGSLLSALGRFDDAELELQQQRTLSQQVGDQRAEARALIALAIVARESNDVDASHRRVTEALRIVREIGEPIHEAEALLERGALNATLGSERDALDDLTHAARLAEEHGLVTTDVLASCYLALLPGGDVARAEAALAEHESRLAHRVRMEAQYLAWRFTGNQTHLAEAHRLLQFLIDHAPEEYRDTMVENVPLHRDIAAAWAAQGGSESGEGKRPHRTS